MAELSLDHDQRDALPGHIDSVRVPQLVWREPTPNAGYRSSVV